MLIGREYYISKDLEILKYAFYTSNGIAFKTQEGEFFCVPDCGISDPENKKETIKRVNNAIKDSKKRK